MSNTTTTIPGWKKEGFETCPWWWDESWSCRPEWMDKTWDECSREEHQAKALHLIWCKQMEAKKNQAKSKVERLEEIILDTFHTANLGADGHLQTCGKCKVKTQDTWDGELPETKGKKLCRKCAVKDISKEDLKEARKQLRE